jgi:hypothetical protein
MIYSFLQDYCLDPKIENSLAEVFARLLHEYFVRLSRLRIWRDATGLLFVIFLFKFEQLIIGING